MAAEREKVELRGYVDAELREIAVHYAQDLNIPLSETVARALASFFNRPDLADVPRKRTGRPLGAVVKPSKGKS